MTKLNTLVLLLAWPALMTVEQKPPIPDVGVYVFTAEPTAESFAPPQLKERRDSVKDITSRLKSKDVRVVASPADAVVTLEVVAREWEGEPARVLPFAKPSKHQRPGPVTAEITAILLPDAENPNESARARPTSGGLSLTLRIDAADVAAAFTSGGRSS